MDRKAFWREQHRLNSSYWLSGTTLDQIVVDYDLDGGYPRAKQVTEIGVGLGYVTKELHERGNTVTAVDIAPEALERVKDYAKVPLLIPSLEYAVPADLALCHLVFQHCEAEMVRHILRRTSLAKDGVFCFQTAYPLRAIEVNAQRVALGEIIWHSHDEVDEIARTEGLDIFWLRHLDFGDEVGWTLYKARRHSA